MSFWEKILTRSSSLFHRPNSIYSAHFSQVPPAGNNGNAPDEKSDIPPDPLCVRHGLIDMMDTEYEVIDRTLHHIEYAKTQKDGSYKRFAGPIYMLLVRSASQHGQTKDDKDVC